MDDERLLANYLADIARYPTLSAAEERRLVRTMRTAPRRETAWMCQRRLIQANLQGMVSVAEKYRWTGVSFLDLIQEGNLGLMRAVERYNPTTASTFGAFAAWQARLRIQRAVGRQS